MLYAVREWALARVGGRQGADASDKECRKQDIYLEWVLESIETESLNVLEINAL